MTDKAKPMKTLRRRVAAYQAMSLPHLIVAELEQMIIRGEFQAGDRINESALATRLGVSRGSVREACRQLERSRLVESRTNRGMFVRAITIDEAAQLYDIRAGLFGLAGRLAAARFTDADAAVLHSKIQQLEHATDIADYYPINVELHRQLVALSGNPRLVELYDNVSIELHLFRRYGLQPSTARHTSNNEHQRILEHLEARNPDEVARLMEAHILAGKNRMLADHSHANSRPAHETKDGVL